MNETTNKINELRNEMRQLEYKIRELERENSNFYIGVYSIGDGDYWDEYYCRLGFISEEKAKTWVEEYLNDNDEVFDTRYFEVSEEKYKKFGDWYELDMLHKSLNTYNSEIRKLEHVYEFVESVNEAIVNVSEEIGINDLSSMHPDEDVFL